MDFAYFVENSPAVEERNNRPVFSLIYDLGIPEDNVYCDVDDSKEALKSLIKTVKEGDRIIARSLFDLSSYNVENLMVYLKILQSKAVELHIVDHPCVSDYLGYYTVLNDFISLFKEYKERKRRAGYEQAKLEKRVGRKVKDVEDVARAIKLYESKVLTVAEIVEMTGVSRSTLYKYLRVR